MIPSGSPNRSTTCPTSTSSNGRWAQGVGPMKTCMTQGGYLLGILASSMGQETDQGEVDIALAGLGLERVLIGPDEIAQTVNHETGF